MNGDGLLYNGEHIFYCITHGAIQRVDPVDKCVATRRGEERADCEFVDAMVGGRMVTFDKALLSEALAAAGLYPYDMGKVFDIFDAAFAAGLGVDK